ncbi:MAG: hypothetical protein DRI69_06495, partial [Bacteroidetes bacterium]
TYAHVELNYPQGGETFDFGETVTIQWSELVPHGTLYWHLYFSSDGGTSWDDIQLNIPYGTTTYDWTVPSMNTSQGVVRVVQDNAGMDYEHASLNFTIAMDSAAPAIDTDAQDKAIECSTADQTAMIQNWLDDNGEASATSSCGDLTWSNDYSGLSDGCGASGNASVTFTCTDECGKSSTTSAMLTVSDNIAPVIDNPAQDMTVECTGFGNPPELMAWLNSHGGAMASDACGTVDWTDDNTGAAGGCGNTGADYVIFTATDACGNSTTTSATFTIEDTTPPVVETAAQDMTLECDAADQQVNIQAWIASHGGAVASDLCGNVTWANDYAGLSDQCGSTGSAEVTFTITDECGNSSTTKAVLTIVDSEAPVIETMAQDISVACDDADRTQIIQGWLDNNAGATATDLCGDVTWSNNYITSSEDCVGQTTQQVSFTAEDPCGNTVAIVADIINTLSTGTADLSELSNVLIYPNPSSDNLHVDFDAGNTVTKSLFLYEMGGKLVWKGSGPATSWVISVSDFNSGIYLFRVITEEGSIISKLVVE